MNQPKAVPLRTKFTEIFNCDYPIVSAPMFLVSDAGMVEATTNAGGLGAFPALNYRPVSEFRKIVRELRKKQVGPFGVNIIVQSSNKHQAEQLDICVEEGVDLIITSLGSPKRVLKLCEGTKTKVFCDVVGYEHAKKVSDLGAHGLIAVGSGAGGHAGTVSPFALIPYLKQFTDIPVIAAGSIVGGAGMLAAFSLGADGVYMGTRFIASREAPVSKEYKQAILSAKCEDVIYTDRVDGFPANFILNDRLRSVGLEPSLAEQIFSRSKRVKRGISLLRAARALIGAKDNRASYKTVFSAGHGVGLIHEEKTIYEIIQNTMHEYYDLKRKLP